MSLPSIKISRSSPGVGPQRPSTPVSDGEAPTSPITDSDRLSEGGEGGGGGEGKKDSPKASISGSFINSTWSGDTEKPPTPTRGGRKDSIQRETSTADPVTLSILRRAGTENTVPKSLRNDGNDDTEKPAAYGSTSSTGWLPDNTKPSQGRGKRKGVSFLSRIMGSKKKTTDEAEENEAVDDRRTEGMNAAVFSQPIGFIPTFPAPPKYIRVHSHQKPQRDFGQVFLAQELPANLPAVGNDTAADQSTTPLDSQGGKILAMKFSKDGKFLAAGGQDKIVRVWQVLGSNDDRAAHEQREDAAGIMNDMESEGPGVRLHAPVFMSEPIQQYHGHTADILALSWSKNNFLLSSSMDKTVRLWHVTRRECLCCFQHSDFVTSIAFHPRDDRFFLAGSLDSKLRLWSIPDKSVAFWNELPDLITAVAFTPDGRMAIAGCLNGLCLFYETEGLHYHTQLHVRSSHGRNAKGSKITGIETISFPPDDPNGEVKILVTSNDSRVRMYNARDKSLETKFKGYENSSSQIYATFSDDAKYIISGSEDRKVYIWNVDPGDAEKKDKKPVEFFEAHSAIVAVAIMAPVKTKQVLGLSGDPIYDLCNPPPVTLVSRSDSLTSSSKRTATATHSDDLHQTTSQETNRLAGNSSWNARSNHPAGNIIVTADYTGCIKIFRQDCAATKRKKESRDTNSALARIGTGILRRGSVSHPSPDRIMSWRQSIASINSLDGGSIRSRSSLIEPAPATHRSTSPSRPGGGTLSMTSSPSKFSLSVGSLRSRAQSLSQAGNRVRNGSIGKNSVRSDGDHGELRLQRETFPTMTTTTTTTMMTITRELSHQTSGASEGVHGQGRVLNIVSSDEDDDGGIFSSDAESEGEAVRCRKCGSTSFKAKQRRGEHKLVCVKCNTTMT